MNSNENIEPIKVEQIEPYQSANYVVYKINKRIAYIFRNEAMKHKDIFELFQEVENGVPTYLEVKAYEELKYKFSNLITFIFPGE